MGYSTNEMLLILYKNKRNKLITLLDDLLSDGIEIPDLFKLELESLDHKIKFMLRFKYDE